MRILVTGGLGFIGTNFVELLLERTHCHIIIVDKVSYAANLKNLQKFLEKNPEYKSRITIYQKDISLLYQLENIFKIEYIDTIVNIAAETHVDNSILTPLPFVFSNINGTANLLEMYRKHEVKKFVQVSTDEVYGAIEDKKNINSQKFKEQDILKPSSVYSSTKASSDLIALSYYKTYGANVSITRCCNNYGPYQHEEKLLPKIIHNAINDIKIPIYGKGNNMREWIYVRDHCEAILKVINYGKAGEIYNVGTGELLENIDLTNMILRKLKKPAKLIEFVDDRKGHDFIYAVNSSKITKELKWTPKMSFDKGIEKTIKWYTINQ